MESYHLWMSKITFWYYFWATLVGMYQQKVAQSMHPNGTIYRVTTECEHVGGYDDGAEKKEQWIGKPNLKRNQPRRAERTGIAQNERVKVERYCGTVWLAERICAFGFSEEGS